MIMTFEDFCKKLGYSKEDIKEIAFMLISEMTDELFERIWEEGKNIMVMDVDKMERIRKAMWN